MNWTLAFEPLLPVWLLAAIGVVGLLFILPGPIRRMRGSAWRALAALLLFLALLNPVALREDRDPLPTTVALVTDQSASQGLDGRDKVTAAAKTAILAVPGAFGLFRAVMLRRAAGSAAHAGVFALRPSVQEGDRS